MDVDGRVVCLSMPGISEQNRELATSVLPSRTLEPPWFGGGEVGERWDQRMGRRPFNINSPDSSDSSTVSTKSATFARVRNSPWAADAYLLHSFGRNWPRIGTPSLWPSLSSFVHLGLIHIHSDVSKLQRRHKPQRLPSKQCFIF